MSAKKGFDPKNTTVKRTIVLPFALARRADTWARAEGKSLSDVIQDALRQASVKRRFQELRRLQKYWNRKACVKGVLTERELTRRLRER